LEPVGPLRTENGYNNDVINSMKLTQNINGV
jgi:hypothetical protein